MPAARWQRRIRACARASSTTPSCGHPATECGCLGARQVRGCNTQPDRIRLRTARAGWAAVLAVRVARANRVPPLELATSVKRVPPGDPPTGDPPRVDPPTGVPPPRPEEPRPMPRGDQPPTVPPAVPTAVASGA